MTWTVAERGLVCAVVVLVGAAAWGQALTVEEMLDQKALVDAYNPELIDYLLEEGHGAVPDDLRQAALDQLVSALKQDIEITPEEQRAAAMSAAAAGVAQLLGGSSGSEYGGVAQDATHQIWSGWVDSAFTLQRAGYAEESNAFFEKCVEVFPYSDLRGRCAIGLAVARPNEAYDRMMALTDANDNDTINAVLPLLGELAGSDGFPDELRGQVIARLDEFTGGMKKATFGVAACRGLVATKDDRAVPTLQKLSKGMMNADFFPCSRAGLLLTFNDRNVVPLLEKQLKGGTFSTTTPLEQLSAASLLMRAGEPSGFAFAEQELTKKHKKGGFGKLMKSSSDDVDLRPALVTALVRAGGADAVRVLRSGMAAVEKGTWLETWIAVGLLELGDTSQIGLAKTALTNPEWSFTTVRIATALAANGDYAGVPAMESLYTSAASGVEPDWGKAALAYLAGDGSAYESNERAKRARLIRLRQQISDALATIDQPQCVPVLTAILGDAEPSVRVAAAYALARMEPPDAAAGLATAMATDFGAVEGKSRNPVVHGHVMRTAAARFPDHDATRSVIETGLQSPFASVRFLSLCVADQPEQSSEEGAS
jgi:hypothetical protein